MNNSAFPSPNRAGGASSQSSLTPALLRFVIYTVGLAGLIGLATEVMLDWRTQTRGIESGSPVPPHVSGLALGTNVALEQYTTDTRRRLVATRMAEAGLVWARQHFPWAAIEPHPGEFDWAVWDGVVDTAQTAGLHLLAVLDTTPEWARAEADRDNRFAPPRDPSDFARFAAAFATRYGDRIDHYEIWDEPNIYPHWGNGEISPRAYVVLLRAASVALKTADPGATVLTAGLAPTAERTGRNLSEVEFLRAMYRAGARDAFDILAIKPYGFWSGPDDRRVNPQVLNFSRAILLREVMAEYGDTGKAVWAVESGWNTLPDGWTGQASPWGSDDAGKQARRLLDAIRRARAEWRWLDVMFVQVLDPPAAPDDPIRGFALLNPDLSPRVVYEELRELGGAGGQGGARDGFFLSPLLPRSSPPLLELALLAVGIIVVGWQWARLAPRLPWQFWWARAAGRYRTLPEAVQFGVLVLVAGAFYLAPGLFLSLPLLIGLLCLVAARLDLALPVLVFTIPFFLQPKPIAGLAFSMVEILTLLCFAAWTVERLTRFHPSRITHHIARFTELPDNICVDCAMFYGSDWPILLFLALSLISPCLAENQGVATRELRVIVLEPIMLYVLVSRARLPRRTLFHMVDALVLAGIALSMIGLAQLIVGGAVQAEGVMRIRSVYGSPNNLSLFLGRVFPLLLVFGLFGTDLRRRRVYALAALPISAALFLTFSMGAWLAGLPAAVLFIGLMRGRRALAVAAGLIGAAGLALLPFARAERVARLLDIGSSRTGQLRLKLWEATLNMIRDHPWFGVGLDNFLYQYREVYVLPEARVDRDLSHPHNFILDWWTRLGILGPVALIWMLVLFFRDGVRLYRSLSSDAGLGGQDPELALLVLGLMGGMVDTVAHGLLDHSYFLVDLAFVFMLALGVVRRLTPGSISQERPWLNRL